MKWYLMVLKKYAVLSGRARRKEYWMFVLFNMIVNIILGAISAQAPDLAILGTIYSLAVLIPSIAVGVRRMHDTDHSGWWIIVPLVNLIFAVTEGTRGSNRFGPDPKSEPDADQAKPIA